jgi:hypothetical protein
MFNKQIYYAHSMKIYDTNQEQNEYSLIHSQFPLYKIFCPNNNAPISWHNLTSKDVMTECLQKVKKSKIVIASEYQNHIGKGVFSEVNLALALKKPVYVVRGNKFIPVNSIKIIDANDWGIKYGQIVTT